MMRPVLGLITALFLTSCDNAVQPTASGEAEPTASRAPQPPINPPGLPSTGNGWEVVRRFIDFPPGVVTVQTVSCPPGKKAVTGGNVVVYDGVEYLQDAGLITSTGDAAGFRSGGGTYEAFVICIYP